MGSLNNEVSCVQATTAMFIVFVLTFSVFMPVTTAQVGSQSVRGPWDGNWNTYWSGHYLAMVLSQGPSDGSHVDGCFSTENFQAALMCPYTMSGTASGRTLKGTYLWAFSGQQAAAGGGSFEFEISADGKSFAGKGEGEMPDSQGKPVHWSGSWTGQLVESTGTTPPARTREIPWDIVIGVGALVLVTVAIARALGKKSDKEKKDNETVSFILELSTDRLKVRVGQPAKLAVTAWRVDRQGVYKPAPDAKLEIVRATSERLSILPTNGMGKMDVTVSIKPEPPISEARVRVGNNTTLFDVMGTAGGSKTTATVRVEMENPRLVVSEKDVEVLEPDVKIEKPKLVEVAAQMPVTKPEEGFEGYNPSAPTVINAYVIFGEKDLDKDLGDEKWSFSAAFDPPDPQAPEVNVKNTLGRKAKIEIRAPFRSDIPPDPERFLKVTAEKDKNRLEERVNVAVYHRLCPEALEIFNIETDMSPKATHLRTSFHYVRRSWMDAINRYDKLYATPAYTTNSGEGNPIDAGLWLFGYRDQKSIPAAKYTFTPRDEKYEVPAEILNIVSWINTEVSGKSVRSTGGWVAPQNTEAALAQDIINEYNKEKKLLSPGDVLYLALKQTSGDVRMAMLMAHNTLRALARDEGDFNWCGIRQLPIPFNKIFEPIRGNRVGYQDPKTDSFATDYGGPWYHLFGTAFYELETAGGTKGTLITTSWTDFAQEFEQFYREWFGGQLPDPEKYCINLWGALIARELFNTLKHDYTP